MGDYERSVQSATTEETAVSTSQAVCNPCESMWDGWPTQTSSADACTPAVTLADLQVQGSGVQVKNYQTDMLSYAPWLSGFQPQAPGALDTVGHDQAPSQLQGGSVVYQDEFSLLNICSTQPVDRQLALALTEGTGSHASQLFMESCSDKTVLRPNRAICETRVSEGSSKSESALYLRSPGDASQSNNFDKVIGNTDPGQHMVQASDTDLSSRTSSPPSTRLPSYGQMMQHLAGPQYDNTHGHWLSCVTTSSSHLQTSENGLRHVQRDPTGPICNTSSESVILHHHRFENDSFSNNNNDPYCTTAENMYAELHGLLTKSQLESSPSTQQPQQAPASCSSTVNTVNYGAGWSTSQLSDVTMQGEQTCMYTPDTRTTGTPAKSFINRSDDPSSSNAGTSRSGILNPARATLERQEKRSLRVHDDEPRDSNNPALKRPCIEQALWQSSAAFLGRVSDPKFHASISSSYGLGTSSSLDMHSSLTSVGPALNTNGRPRARRGSATDPQSVYARHRRERITERLKILQHLVPNGAKVDIVTMLEEAINYVKFLQIQVTLLSSDENWIYAPTTYNGVDVSMGMHFQGMDSQA